MSRGERTVFGIPRWFALALAAQVLVAALVVCLGIGSRPFWHDEVASVSVATRSFGGVFDVLGDVDANMGFYYLLLHIWMWGGESEGWVRLLSGLAVVATVPVTSLLARRLFGDAVGALAGFLLAANGFVVLWAQQARGYALALLLTTLATWALVETCRKPRTRRFAAYAAAAVLSVYANLFSVLILLAHVLSLAFLPQARKLRRELALTYGAIALATAPLAVFLAVTASGQVSWVGRPNLNALGGTANRELGGEHAALSLVVGALVIAGLIVLWRGVAAAHGGRRASERRWELALLASWLALPPAVLWIVSQAKPFYIDRYLISIAPAVAILAAVGLKALLDRSRPLAALAAVVLAALAVVARTSLEPDDPEDLRAAADWIAADGSGSDGIAYAPAFARVGADWYLERAPDVPRGLPDDFGVAPNGSAAQVGDLYAREIGARALVERLRRHPRIWLVGYPDSDWHPTPEPMLDRGLAALRMGYEPVRSRDFDGVHVTLYERANGK